MDVTNKILQLEGDLRQLIKRWDRFFVGDLRVPPVQEKDLLGRRIRMLSEQHTQRSSDIFRLQQLQHRFMAYATNWQRMLKEQEEGIRRYVPGRRRPSIPVQPPKSPEKAVEELSANDSAPTSVDEGETRSLFDRWKLAKEGLGQDVKMDRALFDRQIADQRRRLEKKMGHPVEFEVSVGDGRVKLSVRKTVS